MPRIIHISDTHEQQDDVEIPEGDILAITGDITYNGELIQIRKFNTWLGTLPHTHKVIISGNHDWNFTKPGGNEEITNGIYLQDSGVEIMGLKFWGAPWQPWFHDWAFNLERGAEIQEKWDLIPSDTNVLLTHGPPMGIGDRTPRGQNVGCQNLLDTITNRLGQLKLHAFGHIHHSYGLYKKGLVTFTNGSICNEQYKPVNKPLVIDL